MSLELRIQSLLKNDPSRIFVTANPAQTVDSLISAYCIEKGIRQRTDYVLANDLNEILHHTSTVGSCGIKSGDILYLKNESVDEGKAFGCNTWWILAAVLVLIGIVGIVTVSVIENSSKEEPLVYGVVFDAGSTHTKSFVYKWQGKKTNNTGVVTQLSNCSVKGPPLAQMRHKVGVTLSECLNKSVDTIPSSKRSSSPLYLGATAGMRVLNATDPDLSELILGEVRDTFATSGLKSAPKSNNARIISGVEEGSFGWITVNYLLGSLGNFVHEPKWDIVPSSPSQTVGALDMGGASLQITFVPSNATKDMPSDYSSSLNLFGENYTLYTTSFLCYGKMEAERKLLALLVEEQDYLENITNPCAPVGNYTTEKASFVFQLPCTQANKSIPTGTTYKFHGTSNSTQCREIVDKMVDTSKCNYKSCAFDGVYMPELYGSFIAFNSFLFVAMDLNLTVGEPPDQGIFTLEAFRNATNEFCSKNYDEIATMSGISDAFRTKLCFDAHYIDIILTKGFKFTPDYWRKHLYFKRKIREFEVGWTLGFMINATNSFPSVMVEGALSTFAFALLLALFILFLLLSIGFACHAHRINDKKGTYKKLSQSGQAYGSI